MIKNLLTIGSISLLIAGCTLNNESDVYQKIYFGGEILTMDTETPHYIESVVEKDGKIIFTGSKNIALSKFSENSQQIDLKGRTMLPGFVDAHSHVYGVGLQASSANLLPSPDGGGDTVAKIIEILSKYKSDAKNNSFIEKSGWIIGFGYDDAQTDRYPTAADLDKVSTEKPVIIIHTSGHLSVLNTKALALSKIDETSKDPKGGHIRRLANSNKPNGVLEETAHFAVLFKLLSQFDKGTQDNMLRKGQEMYASFGYTTAQEGRATAEAMGAMIRASLADEMLLDVVAYADISEGKDYLNSEYNTTLYSNKFRIGGAKLLFDGSPQGKTAWLTHPYHVVPEGKDKNYKGYSTFTDEKAFALVDEAFKNNWQIITHANGDAAIEQFIDGIELATNKYGNDDRRPVLIHGQTIRKDQIARLVDLKIFPSLFPMHTFYWGDWHENSVLGHPRVDFISPTKSILDAGLKFTTHHDAPVSLPNSFRVIDATVNRTTRTGKVLGPDERVSVYTTLKAMTDWAAYQHFEENSKGTITTGKVADFIILDVNPLKISPANLKDIKVRETIKAGKVIYQR